MRGYSPKPQRHEITWARVLRPPPPHTHTTGVGNGAKMPNQTKVGPRYRRVHNRSQLQRPTKGGAPCWSIPALPPRSVAERRHKAHKHRGERRAKRLPSCRGLIAPPAPWPPLQDWKGEGLSKLMEGLGEPNVGQLSEPIVKAGACIAWRAPRQHKCL